MWKSVLAVCAGASIGALLRWWFGVQLNALLPAVPLGTLASNLVGGYLVGLAIAFFATHEAIAPEWRLLVITGFCGGLTTFSALSVELTLLLQQGRAMWALGTAALQVTGSVAMTFAGIGTVALLRS